MKKKRIIFVDDETLVLQGLRRMLRKMSSHWEMVFAENGKQALEEMAKEPFDVIVSDMRMPDMNGAQLLQKVMELYPNTIRFILSGHADQLLVLNCLDSTHQYIAKPCDPKTLQEKIMRATAHEEFMANHGLKNLVSRLGELPTLPSLYREIVKALKEPDVDTSKIGQIIQKDLGMTAKILKVANSGYFGLAQQVSNPIDAVSYLGVDNVKSIVLTIHAFSAIKEFELDGMSLQDFFNESLHIAGIAKALSVNEKLDKDLVEDAFIAGLLSRAGKLILACSLPEEYKKVTSLCQNDGMTLLEAEREVFNADHAQVGGYLLNLWGLPTTVVEAVIYHKKPSWSLPSDFQPITAVHLTRALLSEKHAERNIETIHLDMEYLDKIEISGRLDEFRELINSLDNPYSDFKIIGSMI
jgi:HD-like signal output (HDOD) protein/CheY-like chemotaxis protein